MKFADVGGVPFVGASSGGDSSIAPLIAMMAMKRDDEGRNWTPLMFLFIVFVIIIFIVVALIWSRGHVGGDNKAGIAEVAALGMINRLPANEGSFGYGHMQHDIARDILLVKEKLAEQTYQLTRDADLRNYETARLIDRNHHDTLLGFKDSELRDRDNTDKVMSRLDAFERRNDERLLAEKDAKINRLETMFAVWGRPPVQGGNFASFNTQTIGVGDGFGYGF